MNLLEKYLAEPNSYMIVGPGGAGKTVSLMHIADKVKDICIGNRKVIPIYIRMADINIKSVDDEILYSFMYKYFYHGVSARAIKEMIDEYSDEYIFLFLLDGVNEVINYMVNDLQNVMVYVQNNIKELIAYKNVHVIMSARSQDVIMDRALSEKFKLVKIEEFSNIQIAKYLGINNVEKIDEALLEIIKSPMLLKMFKAIYSHDAIKALELRTKYELMDKFLKLDVDNKMVEGVIDNAPIVRKFVVDNILPEMAFCVEIRLLDDVASSTLELKYDELLDKVLSHIEIPREITRQAIDMMISGMNIVNNNLQFSHDLIREYFCVKYLLSEKRTDEFSKIEAENIKNLIVNLTEALKYIRDRGKDLIRRTRHIGLAELLYGAVGDKLNVCLLRHGIKDERMVLNFYYELGGLYDDLNEPRLSSEVSWIAIEELEKIESTMESKELSDRLNFLFFSVNNYGTRDPLYIIKKSEEEWHKISDVDKLDKEVIKLYGRILSNYGSYYISRFCNPKKPETAYTWHEKSLEYRTKNNLTGDIEVCHKNIMTDYFHMSKFDMAYEHYKKGIFASIGETKLSQWKREGKAYPSFDLVERVIGNEIVLLADSSVSAELKHELVEEIPYQIKYVYEQATKPRRRHKNTIKNLSKKLATLTVWITETENACDSAQVEKNYGVDNFKILKEVVKSYHCLCAEI